MKKIYKVEVDCANCAAKIEDKINKMKNIEEVNLNFMMEKLSIEFKVSTDEDVEEIMDEVRKLVKKLEPDAVIS